MTAEQSGGPKAPPPWPHPKIEIPPSGQDTRCAYSTGPPTFNCRLQYIKAPSYKQESQKSFTRQDIQQFLAASDIHFSHFSSRHPFQQQPYSHVSCPAVSVSFNWITVHFLFFFLQIDSATWLNFIPHHGRGYDLNCKNSTLDSLENNPTFGKCPKCLSIILRSSCTFQVSASLHLVASTFKFKLAASGVNIAEKEIEEIDELSLLQALPFNATYSITNYDYHKCFKNYFTLNYYASYYNY